MLKSRAAILAVLATASFFASASEEKHSVANHWAFRAPRRAEPPPDESGSPSHSPIDRLVRARLHVEGLSPSPPADRYTLIRRLSLDLTGLPPSIEEVDAFVEDDHPDAYRKVVDRLLSSPRHAERRALWWLDLARYADSNGYESDRTRSIWPWRDWVIKAFGDDQPFDEFAVEQLAGDMLPGATISQRIATGFHRNTWINEEGGHDWEQFRWESVVDRVHTTATVFLGLTVACAQCHDHKYDPITQREYWQLFAFLNNADEPDLHVPDTAIQERQNEIDAERSRRDSEHASHFPPLDVVREWTWTQAVPASAESEEGASLSIGEDGSIVASGVSSKEDAYVVVVDTPLEKIEGIRLEVLPAGPKRAATIGRADDGNFVLSDLRLRASPRSSSADPRPRRIDVEFVAAREDRPSFAQNYHVVADAIDGNPKTGWAGDRASTDLSSPRDVSFTMAKPVAFSGGARLEFRFEQRFGRSLTMRRFRVSLGVAAGRNPRTSLGVDESRRRNLDAKLGKWIESPGRRPIDWRLLDPARAISEGRATMNELDDGSILVTGDRPEVDTYEIESEPSSEAARVTGFRLEALPDARLPNHGPGRGSFNGDGAFVVTEFRAEIVAAGRPARPVKLANAYANYQNGHHKIANAIDGNKLTSWFIGGGAGRRHVAVFGADRAYEIERGARLRLTILQNFVHQQTLGRFRLFVTGDELPLHSDPRPTIIDRLLRKGSRARTDAENRVLRDHFLSIAPELQSYNDKTRALRDSRPRFPTTFVFAERRDAERRSTHVHTRGEFSRSAEEVSPAVPSVLHSFPKGEPRNRLTFARWLVDDRNPLVARVIANQLWQSSFGRGIVSTPENFGIRGARPSHPKLLDWLAVELRDSGWSLRHLEREIVLSSVYRQSSRVTPEVAERDPQNVFLAHGPRVRVDAETIRDIAMASSGLLVGKIGGPSVFPPQPAAAGTTFGPFRWKDSPGTGRYRRGLYTFRKRGGPYAAFSIFDAPPPNTCTMARRRSNTPLQALAQLNDTVLVEASRSLARRILNAGPKNDEGRARYAFRLVLTRPPASSEVATIVEFLARQRRRLESGSLDAAAISEISVDTNDEDLLVEHAAWTTVARLLFNLDEAITKE